MSNISFIMTLIIKGSFTITQLSRDQPLGITITQKDLAEGTEVNFVDEKEYWNT